MLESWLLPKPLGGRIKGVIGKSLGLVLGMARVTVEDCIEKIANTGIKTIIQPGGSIRDQDVIDACNKYSLAMAFTGARCFKH